MSADIDKNVKQLRDSLNFASSHLEWPSVNLKEFWADVRKLNELLRTLRPVPHEERGGLRSELDVLCQKARRIQEERDNDSRIKREAVESKIAEARVHTRGDGDDLRKARELLNEALEWMKDGWEGFNWTTQLTSISSGKMSHRDHEECWKQWREVNDAVGWRYRELRDLNYESFRSEAMEASGNAETNPKLAKEQVKAIQGRMRGAIMSKEQFEDLRNLLDRIWSRATEIAKEHHDEWRSRKFGHLAKKRELIERQEEIIAKIEGEIEHCQELEAGAKTEDFAEMVRGWIEEKYEKIESRRRFIEELELQIDEIEEQLKK